MGTNCAVYLANFYLFSYEFDFLKRLLKNNTCPVVLHRLPLVHRFVDDFFGSCFSRLSEFYVTKPRLFWLRHIPENIL